jgi:hypothetical protein
MGIFQRIFFNVLIILLILVSFSVSPAAVWYVDNAASGSNNGTSWTNAWTSLSAITGVSAGDTVYISGGSVSKTYNLASGWTPRGGSAGNPVTYRIGQDAGHNGTANISISAGIAVVLPSYVIIDGEYSGNRRIAITGGPPVHAEGKTQVTIKYLTLEGDNNFYGCSYYEIAYCYIHGNYDHALGMGNPPAAIGWDVNKVHHNYILLDSGATGIGVDGIQWGNSMSVYNNTFVANPVGYSVGQHMDGIQTDGAYFKIYNNVFQNISNYPVFFECFGDVSNVRVYNNVVFVDDENIAGGGIVAGRSGGASGTVHMTNFIFANNTVFSVSGSAIAMSPGAQTVWDSSSYYYNNISYNCGVADYIDPNITGYRDPSNKRVNDSNCGSHFVACQNKTKAFPYNFHLLSTDTAFLDKGSSAPSSYFLTDIDGVPRPEGSAWDIGAYELNTNAPQAPRNLRIIQNP